MKGYVGDENGEPVIGATVLESGTQNGVITDVDGIFTIQLAKNASLTISYVGYQKKTVVVKDKKFISVNLTPDRSMKWSWSVLANKRKNPSWELCRQ